MPLTKINAFEVSNDADTVPPAEITDLIASPGLNRGEVQLSWTATGDDAMSGGASKYIIRYATVPITELNWENIQTYDQSWTPATSGTSEAKILFGLTPGQTYYFAIKALDDANLSSNLSNVVIATTSSAQGTNTVPIGTDDYRVFADNLNYINGSEVIASGNVSLNEQLYFTGDVHINLNTLIIQGNGNVFIPDIPLMGDVYLFEHGFEFNLSALITSGLESISQVAGIDLEIEEMEFLWNNLQPDGVKVTATVKLPDYLVSGEININELEISRTNGISGSIDIPVDDYIQIKGSKWKLTKSENNPTEPLMEFDSHSGQFKGQARLVMTKFELEASISFLKGQLYGIGICYGFPEPGKVILVIPPPTGPIPIVYLQEICGAVENIPNPKALIFRATADISAGPKISDYYLVGLNNSGLELDLSSRATLSGTLVLGGSYDLAYAEVFIDWHDKVFGANGEMNALNIFTAQASFIIDAELNIAGRADGNLYIPDEWYYWPISGKQLANVLGLLDNNGIKGQVQVAGQSWLSAAFGFDWEGNFDVAKNIESLSAETLSAQKLLLSLKEEQLLAVGIPADAEVIYIRVRWTGEGDSAVDLIKPDDSRITSSDCSADPDVYCESSTKEFWYALHNPEAGQWQVDIIDPAGLGDITMEVLSGNGKPFIQLTEPSTNTSTDTTLQIAWIDSDDDDNATISLWYDTDTQGYDGSRIVDNLSEDDTVDAYTWNLSTIPTGHYYIYAQIDDGKNPPVRSYAAGRVEVINPTYPATPSNLQSIINDQLVELSWDEVVGCTYMLYYTENLLGDSYENYISLTEDTQWTVDGLMAGKEIKFAVQAIDSELRASLISSPITVAVPSRPQIITGVGIIDFGDVSPATLPTKATSIQNTGNTNLVITCLKFVGQDQSAFSINKLYPFTIEPGAEEQVEIIMHPNKRGNYISTFQIVSNDPQKEISEISLSATVNYLCSGDFDIDSDVDGSDLAVFAADFGRTDCSGDCEGDFDNDNDVDGSDLAVFAADFGRTDCP